jgi:hypothetical protein
MECFAERMDAASQPRTRANLCARCQWGSGGACTWALAEFAKGGWRMVEVPVVRWERCESYSASVDDPATR